MRGFLFALASALALATMACGPRVQVDTIVSNDDFRIALRRTVEAGEPQSRGYAHPTTVADVRLAHILANLEFENSEGRRAPAIRSVHVYPLAEALNQAILKATPSDEVIATVFSGDRRLGVFTTRKVTSFRLFFQDDVMRIEFFDIERTLDPGDGKPGRDEGYRIPEQVPEAAPSFRVLTTEGLTADGRRALQVQWRDPYFAKPVALSVRGNRLKRRTVLMDSGSESTETASDPEPIVELSPELRDAQISALDQLEALRRQGLVKEAEFQRRRRLILEGNLEEAGYGTAQPSAQP